MTYMEWQLHKQKISIIGYTGLAAFGAKLLKEIVFKPPLRNRFHDAGNLKRTKFVVIRIKETTKGGRVKNLDFF